MKAPNKIYVHEGAHLGMLTLTTIPVDTPGEEIYIRKDALMEWAKGKITVEEATEGIVGGYNLALKDVINKLNSM